MTDIEKLRQDVIDSVKAYRCDPVPGRWRDVLANLDALDAAEKPGVWALLRHARYHISDRDQTARSIDAALAWHERQEAQDA